MKLLAILLIFVSAALADENEYEKIAYEFTDNQPESGKYQVRRFLGGELMACTNIRARSDKIATVVGKRRLQRYLNGKNKEGIQVKKGNPFNVLHPKRSCVGKCRKTFRVCMFISKKHQNNPPKPHSSLIYFVPMKSQIGYTWHIPNSENGDWNYQMSEFAKVLGEEKLSKTYDFFYAISYHGHPWSPVLPMKYIAVVEKSAELDHDNTYYGNKDFGFIFNTGINFKLSHNK